MLLHCNERQDSKQLTSLLPWHASARTEEREGGGACVYSVLVGVGILAWRHKRRRRGGCREITLFVIKWCFHFQSELLEECGFRDSGKHFLALERGRQGADTLRNGFAKKLHPLFFTLSSGMKGWRGSRVETEIARNREAVLKELLISHVTIY